MRSAKVAIAILYLALMTSSNSFAIAYECRKIDEFGDMSCEDEQARLDNYGVQLYDAAESQSYIVFYEGKYYDGRKPRHGEAFAEASKYKDYLVRYRSIEPERIVLLNGGYRENFTVELYICPRNIAWPTSTPTLKVKDVKFAKGKIKKIHYEWGCG